MYVVDLMHECEYMHPVLMMVVLLKHFI